MNKTILITGGTSGIGFQAAKLLLKAGCRLIIICRNQERSKELLLRFKNDNSIGKESILKNLDLRIADLADLNSLEKLTNKLIREDILIDIIILNAGLQYTGSKDIRLSKQSIELTFAVNHLSHQYLIQRLMKLVIKSEFPRIIVTASEVHNPLLAGGKVGRPAGLGNLLGLSSLKKVCMIDGTSIFNADKAYKDSKLCNVIFSRELYRRLKLRGLNIPIICWAPGLVIPRSKGGFFRYSRKYNELGQIVFSFIARDLLRITESVEKAGQILF